MSRLMKHHPCVSSTSSSGTASSAAGGGGSGAKSSLVNFVANPIQRQQFIDNMIMFFITSETPFTRLENEWLKKAASIAGIQLPSRHAAATTHLNALFEKVKKKVGGELVDLAKGPSLQMSFDGWKKKAANQGEPLVNAKALKPNGGAIFLCVVRAAGVTNNAAWLAETMMEKALEAVGGNASNVLGVLCDNTSANLNAMQMMEEENPGMVNLGCVAHALALLIKDLAKEKHASGVAKVLGNANDVANCINDSESLRAFLHQHQVEVMAKTFAIDVHSPSRFAGIFFVLESVLRNRPAIRSMVMSEAWDEKVADNAKAKAVFADVARENWSNKCQSVSRLIKPVCDAIHQVEADRPLLSQVLPVWNAIIDHVDEWHAAAPAALRLGVKARFLFRLNKHFHPAWASAHLLDPAYAREDPVAGWRLPFAALTNEQLLKAKALIKRLATAKAKAAAAKAAAGGVAAAPAGGTGAAAAGGLTLEDTVSAAVEAELLRLQLGGMPSTMAAALPVLTARRQVGDKQVMASIEMRRNWWVTMVENAFPHVAGVAVHLLSLHTTTCAAERNWSAWGRLYTKSRARLDVSRAEKLIYIKGNLNTDTRSEDEEVLLSVE
ncbi:hypothetical protein HXX76_007750 [Chlamydomonas incerta]|uniref:DUF659 domain-containing protein n=1 Tax=Chlamydomonas incerta TaxID=51695 RepID=A0A835T0K3_CHLIN|nr:hypothetical protein HXX76_007750 [Chlamydomonas incerta]|eukprot:KAG2434867.1 hypothetical protein HXX76_007750 [Chlamydomonas incerta]